jgi:hypothetical protein
MKKLILPATLALLISMPAAARDNAQGTSPVIRALFTTAINDHEPAESMSELNSDTERVFLFTELRDMTGERVIHSWEYKGEVITEMHIDVEGPLWKGWSSKTLTPAMQGTWTVVVMNAAGEILAEKTLDYNPEDPAF